MNQQEIPIPNSNKRLLLEQISPNLTRVSIRSDSRTNKVGVINKAEKTLTVFRNRLQHQHMRTSSYGFNDFLIRNSKLIDKIKIEEDNEGKASTYIVPKMTILDTGVPMNWIDEVQIFVSIELLERFYKL